MAERIVIHIGVAKSGTTSLQNNIFANLPNVCCLGKPNHLNKIYKAFSDGITAAENYQLDDFVSPFVSSVRSAPEPIAVISDEMFTEWNVFSLVACRLAKYFPKAHILITVRNQLSAIPSHYASHGRILKDSPVTERIKYVSFREYFDFYSKRHKQGFFRQLKYFELAKTYANCFSREQITILTFEEMIRSPLTFFDRIADLFDVSPELFRHLWSNSPAQNRGDSGRFHAYLRARSKIPIKSFGRIFRLSESASDAITALLKGGKRAGVRLSKHDTEKIAAIYGSENAALEREFGVSLARWEYPLAMTPAAFVT